MNFFITLSSFPLKIGLRINDLILGKVYVFF